MKKKLVLLVTLIVILFTMTGCGKSKIDVTESVTVNFSGVNGYGVAEIDNAYEWEDQAMEKAGIESIDDFDSLGNALMIESAVSYEVTPNENLSNGDEVTVKAIFDNEDVEKYDIMFVADEKKFTVEGLSEVQHIDLFKDIDVTYSGIAPNVNANINEYSSYPVSNVTVSYSLDKVSNLSNDDIVTVTAEYDKEKLLKAGYVAESDIKEFTVSNVSRYASKLSDITEDANAKLQKQSEDIIKSNIANLSGYSLNKINFLGNYFLVSKGINPYYKNNYIFYVYEVNLTGNEEMTFYYYIGYYDIIITESGECSYDFSKCVKPNETYKWVGWTAVNGYENIDLLYNHCVTKNLADYEYESTVMAK